ncbi:MAG: TolC family protein [Crocinitomicaceae bacterium]
MRSLIIYILMFLFGLTGFAQDSLNNVLTYEEYMRIVKTHHPVARQANILVESSGAYLNKAQGAFDPTLSGSANQKYFKDQQYYSMLNGQLKIPTWFGVSFHGGYDLNNGIYLNPERNLPDDGLWYAGINVSLGKGLIIDERRAQYKKAKIYQEASIQEQILLLNDLQLNASIAYWEWFKASTKVVIYEEAVDNAQERFENVKQSAILGDKPFIDTLEAYIQLQNRLIKLLDAELEKMNSQSYMEIFLWQDGFVPVEIESSISCPGLNNISYRTIDPQLALRVDSLKTYHPEILNTQYKIDQKKVDLQLSQNNLLPELNFKYNALTYSDDGNLMDNYSVNNYNWGAQVKIPLFLRKERGDLRINKLKLESLEYDLAFKTEQLEYKIESALNGWSNSYQKILINERVVNNYYLLLESEKVLFDIGESSLFMVNSREKAYISSRIELVEYLIENKKSELKAYYALGIISKNNLW